MSSNRYYNEWEKPRKAVLLRPVVYLVHKWWDEHGLKHRTVFEKPAGTVINIVGRMTEDTRDSYGGRWLFSSDIGALVEEGVDFEFREFSPKG